MRCTWFGALLPANVDRSDDNAVDDVIDDVVAAIEATLEANREALDGNGGGVTDENDAEMRAVRRAVRGL